MLNVFLFFVLFLQCPHRVTCVLLGLHRLIVLCVLFYSNVYIESSIVKGSKCVVDAPGVLHLLRRVGDPRAAQARPDVEFEMVSCVHQCVFNEVVRHAVFQLGFLRVSAKRISNTVNNISNTADPSNVRVPDMRRTLR